MSIRIGFVGTGGIAGMHLNILPNIDGATNFKDINVNEIDGIKFTWDRKWAHIRPSNTEPIIRIFIESYSKLMQNALWAALAPAVAVSCSIFIQN